MTWTITSATTAPVRLSLTLTRCDECRLPLYAMPGEPETLCRWCRDRLSIGGHKRLRSWPGRWTMVETERLEGESDFELAVRHRRAVRAARRAARARRQSVAAAPSNRQTP